MASFDLPNAAPPELRALQQSFDPGDYRDAIKRLTIDLFREHLGADVFDANVLGMAHLGTFDLVRRFIQADGLGMLRSDREEAATRYLYRAWKKGDGQGRGLHFLRTYLQLLFSEQAEVVQLWHDSRFPYGTAFQRNEPRWVWRHFLGEPGLTVNGRWKLAQRIEPYHYTPDESTLWLTSRLQIRLGLEYIADSVYTEQGRSAVSRILPVLSSILPARLVPALVFWLAFTLYARAQTDHALRIDSRSSIGYPWCGRVLSEHRDRRWSLGVDGALVRLPQAFGTFRLGEVRGHVSVWRLKNCRITIEQIARSPGEMGAYRLPIVGETWRRLDGTWALGRRQFEALSHSALSSASAISQSSALTVRRVEPIRLDYPFTPKRLDARRRLDGHWRLGVQAPALGSTRWNRRLDGFRLGRSPSIPAEGSGIARQRPDICIAPRQLDGSQRLSGWPLGRWRPPETDARTRICGTSDAAPAITEARRSTQSTDLRYPMTPCRLGQWARLDGRWALSAGRTLPHSTRRLSLGGFRLARPVPRRLPGWRGLDGGWRLAAGERLSHPRHPLQLGQFTLPVASAIPATTTRVVQTRVALTLTPMAS